MRKIVLCGAGNKGRELYSFLRYLCDELQKFVIIGVIDSDASKEIIGDIRISRPEDIKYLDSDSLFIITPENEEIRRFYLNVLDGKEVFIYNEISDLVQVLDIDRTTLNRERCAFHHIEGMDAYFSEAEGEELLNVFWGDGSVFKRLFAELDLNNVLEIACGRGRHVPHYYEKAGHITLVDILQKNIDICKKRFGKNEKISYYKNLGFNIEELHDEEYTAIFSYDAMIHFEVLDINSYLNDFYRVLKPGGRALIHHSNFDAMYDGSYNRSLVYGRAFMNYKLFSYLATHAGFIVVDQQLLRWHSMPDMDCVTLLEKPGDGKAYEAVYGKTLKF